MLSALTSIIIIVLSVFSSSLFVRSFVSFFSSKYRFLCAQAYHFLLALLCAFLFHLFSLSVCMFEVCNVV